MHLNPVGSLSLGFFPIAYVDTFNKLHVFSSHVRNSRVSAPTISETLC